MRRAILLAVLVVVVAAGGYLLGSTRERPQPPAQPAQGHVAPSPSVAAPGGASEAELRRIVKEELAAARLGGGSGSAQPAAPPPPPADPAAFDAGMRRVNEAIAQRRWTREDAVAFERALRGSSQEQRTTMLRTLTLALNRGELKPAYRGPLF